MQRVLILAVALVGGGCFLPLGDRVCEMARGRIVAEDGHAGLPCTLNVFMQADGATDKRPFPLGPRAVTTGHDFSYRTFGPSGKLNVTIACDGYAPYESQTFVWEQAASCGPTIDLGTVTIKRPTDRATP
jgi:hypothetical protein